MPMLHLFGVSYTEQTEIKQLVLYTMVKMLKGEIIKTIVYMSLEKLKTRKMQLKITFIRIYTWQERVS